MYKAHKLGFTEKSMHPNYNVPSLVLLPDILGKEPKLSTQSL